MAQTPKSKLLIMYWFLIALRLLVNFQWDLILWHEPSFWADKRQNKLLTFCYSAYSHYTAHLNYHPVFIHLFFSSSISSDTDFAGCLQKAGITTACFISVTYGIPVTWPCQKKGNCKQWTLNCQVDVCLELCYFVTKKCWSKKKHSLWAVIVNLP